LHSRCCGTSHFLTKEKIWKALTLFNKENDSIILGALDIPSQKIILCQINDNYGNVPKPTKDGDIPIRNYAQYQGQYIITEAQNIIHFYPHTSKPAPVPQEFLDALEAWKNRGSKIEDPLFASPNYSFPSFRKELSDWLSSIRNNIKHFNDGIDAAQEWTPYLKSFKNPSAWRPGTDTAKFFYAGYELQGSNTMKP
jgi:hypothetical protein